MIQVLEQKSANQSVCTLEVEEALSICEEVIKIPLAVPQGIVMFLFSCCTLQTFNTHHNSLMCLNYKLLVNFYVTVA